MAKLTKEARDALPDSDFAINRDIPIHDADHVRMALSTVLRASLDDDERKTARDRIIARAKQFGVDATALEKGSRLSTSFQLSAMALNIQNNDHPNKMPFSGILTRIGEPSDAPPDGSGGKLITISKEAAERSLHTLLGMAVNYKSGLDGHAPQFKIGIITDATISGNEIPIKGYIYAADFPKEAAEIKANKDLLGFSYEARELYTNDPDANPCVITDCVFTGAAILLKAKAAYRTTSIAASAAEDDFMTPETKAALDKLAADQAALTASMTAIAASVAKLAEPITAAAALVAKVEPHAAKLDADAAAMEVAGLGDAASGLRKLASDMRAEAAAGRAPRALAASKETGPAPVDVASEVAKAIAPVTAALAAMSTQLADVKAAAATAAKQPERKTLAPAITALLAKNGLEAPGADGEKIPLAKIDVAFKDMPSDRRLEAKASLRQAGLIE